MSIGSVSDEKDRQPNVILQHLSQKSPVAILYYYSILRPYLLSYYLLIIQIDNGQLLAICNAYEQEQDKLTPRKRERNIASATNASTWDLYLDLF
jgi:hypothetical protein